MTLWITSKNISRDSKSRVSKMQQNCRAFAADLVGYFGYDTVRYVEKNSRIRKSPINWVRLTSRYWCQRKSP